MSRLPSLTGDEVVRVLQRIGFEAVRQRGSHVILHHPDGRQTVVPIHTGETIGRGLLRKILDDVGLTRQGFLRMRRG